MDLSTNVASIEFSGCIYNASGCWCTSSEELKELSKSDSAAIVTKSSTIEPRIGNPEPRLKLETEEFGSINSMGIPNEGYLFYYYQQVNFNTKPYIQSVYPFDNRELAIMLNKLNDTYKGKYMVELNLSCPNLAGKSILAYDYERFEECLKFIRSLKCTNLIMGIKLPPYYEKYQFERISDILLRYTDIIKFIVCINSVINGLLIDHENEEPMIANITGGIGGIYCKPVALSNIYNFHKLLGNKIDIIGCGGIRTGKDVFDMLLCGAKLVQVGTTLINEGPQCFTRLKKELIEVLAKKKYNSISEFRGKL